MYQSPCSTEQEKKAGHSEAPKRSHFPRYLLRGLQPSGSTPGPQIIKGCDVGLVPETRPDSLHLLHSESPICLGQKEPKGGRLSGNAKGCRNPRVEKFRASLDTHSSPCNFATTHLQQKEAVSCPCNLATIRLTVGILNCLSPCNFTTHESEDPCAMPWNKFYVPNCSVRPDQAVCTKFHRIQLEGSTGSCFALKQ